jgi:hypothetical protein
MISTASNRVESMTKEEIIELFERYNFRDTIGHSLMMCEDFNVLLNKRLKPLNK